MKSDSYSYLIGIVASGLPFTGKTVYEKSLGGSETAVVSIAKSLAKLGHTVKVFCNTESPAEEIRVDNVSYLDLSTYDHLSSCYNFDLLVVSRNFAMGSRNSKARMKWLWNHDILVKQNCDHFLSSLWSFDKVLFLSNYHKQQYLNMFPPHCKDGIAEIEFVTKNGVDSDYFPVDRVAEKRSKYRFMYTSRPERGLHHLLHKIWPLVKRNYPEAELYCCSYDISSLPLDDYTKKKINDINTALHSEDAKLLDVHDLGSLSKEQLYKELEKTNAVLYPTDFPEISCISMMEALVCGAFPVTTNDFALKETVGRMGYLIQGKVSEEDYIKEYVTRIGYLIDKFDTSVPKRQENKNYILQNNTWDKIAEDWIKELECSFEKRWSQREDDILENLWYHSDIITVHKYAVKHNLENWKIKAEKAVEQIFLEDSPEDYFKHGGNLHTNWNQNARFRLVLQTLLQEAQTDPSIVSEGAQWLDFACGNGDFVNYTNTQIPEINITGIDFSSQLIDEAKMFSAKNAKTPHKLNFNVGDIETLKQYKAAFDVAFAGEYLEHTVNPKEFLTLLEESVKPGGYCVLTVPEGPWEAISWRKDPNERIHHLHHFTLDALQEVFRDDEHKLNLRLNFLPSGLSDRGELLGNWVVVWRRNREVPQFYDVDADRKVFTTRPFEGVTACILMRDNEADIKKTLASIKSFADKIIINDTGSKDRSVEIARSMGAEVYETVWKNDFSAARNYLLDKVKTPWSFVIDTDETLKGSNNIRKYLMSTFFKGFVLQQVHVMLKSDQELPPDTPVRIFKNTKNIRFKGMIHEQPEMGADGVFDVPVNPSVIISEAFLQHLGYLDEDHRNEKLLTRNYPILVKELQKNPQRVLNWVLLMRDHLNAFKLNYNKVQGQQQYLQYDPLNKAIEIYYSKELNKRDKNPYFENTKRIYQEILQIFAKTNAVPFGQRYVPLKVSSLLTISTEENGSNPAPLVRYFLNHQEIIEYLKDQQDKVIEQFKEAY